MVPACGRAGTTQCSVVRTASAACTRRSGSCTSPATSGRSFACANRFRAADGEDRNLLVQVLAVTQRTQCFGGPINQLLESLLAILAYVLKDGHLYSNTEVHKHPKSKRREQLS